MSSRPIGRRQDIRLGVRSCLVGVGAASWIVGGVATFLSSNAAPSAVLIVAGALTSGLGLIGRWPEKVTISGNEVVWPAVTDVVNDQIEVAERAGEPTAVIEELISLRKRLDQLQSTGHAPIHPAVAYDREVKDALRRVRPTSRLVQAADRSNRVADFVLHTNGSQINVETKWQPDGTASLRGRTLPSLLQSLPPDARLLVIANTADTSEAKERVSGFMGQRGAVVTWRSPRHDDRLRETLDSLDCVDDKHLRAGGI